MENKNELVQAPQRNIEVVAAEIIDLRRQAGQMLLTFAIEVGRRLTEAKSLLPHGEWGKWLEEKVNFSQSQANNLMKIFEEYGADQISIFGAVAKSQTIGNLPYTKALALLKVPSDEREEFIESHDIEGLSVRELQKVIKERETAEAERDEAKHKAAELKGQLANAEAEIAGLRDDAKANLAAASEAADRERALREQLAEARKAETEAKEALEAAKDAPVPEDQVKKIAAAEKKKAVEAHKAKVEKLVKETEEKIAAAESQRNAAQKAAEAAEARADELEKKLRMADPVVAAFQVRFDSFLESMKKCNESIVQIRETNPELAKKLSEAMKAAAEQFAGGAA